MFNTYKVGKCRIPELVVKAGISQTQLAHKVGMSKSQITDYVSLRFIPSVEIAKNIANVLNCEIEDLYEWIRRTDEEE